MSNGELVTECREVLSHHARSFRWGAAFLPKDRHDEAAIVYAFCRLVDDLADESPDPHVARTALSDVQQQLQGKAPRTPLVEAFCNRPAVGEIEIHAANDLIAGALSDLEPRIVADDEELLHYCYQVAGTVGLMMCGVLGVDESDARPFAVDLGIAMQLTNIARDVREDAAIDRVYLPAERLRAVGIESKDLLEDRVDRHQLAKVVRDILDLADHYYARGEAGLRYIPRRPRMAICVASRVYRAIGHKLRRQGADAWAGRTIVSGTEKLWHVANALGAWTRTLGGRRAPEYREEARPEIAAWTSPHGT